jgi:CRP-like cAMP-binding protein
MINYAIHDVLVSVLAKIPLFVGLGKEELHALAARAEARAAPGGTVVVREGDPADSLYVVLSGRVNIFLHGNDGEKEVVLATKGPGEYFGEMMLDDNPRSASVVALEPSKFAVISRADFKALILKHPEVGLQVIRNLIRVTRGMNVMTRENTRAREAMRRHIDELEAKKGGDLPAVRRWNSAKRWVLGALLVFAVIQYYFLDVFLQVMSANGVTFLTGQ